jgi:hypothetical protein
MNAKFQIQNANPVRTQQRGDKRRAFTPLPQTVSSLHFAF